MSQKQSIFDPYRDLHPVDSVSSDLGLAYTPEVLKVLKPIVSKINEAFEVYLKNSNKVQITEKNIHNCLFTLCLWNGSTKGILVQIRKDEKTNEFMLLLR